MLRTVLEPKYRASETQLVKPSYGEQNLFFCSSSSKRVDQNNYRRKRLCSTQYSDQFGFQKHCMAPATYVFRFELYANSNIGSHIHSRCACLKPSSLDLESNSSKASVADRLRLSVLLRANYLHSPILIFHQDTIPKESNASLRNSPMSKHKPRSLVARALLK